MSANPPGADAYRTILDAVGDDLAAVNRLLKDRLASAEEEVIPRLAEHLIEAGGKRIRPTLTLAAARISGYGGDRHIPLAAAVELIHSATLLHDDVVDGSVLRRGRAAANTLWGNKLGVLVGDFLFSRSFQLMVEADSLPILGALADAAVTIAEGEVLYTTAAHDLEASDDAYLRMLAAKTAALFAAATQVGAQIANAPQSAVEAFHAYGHNLGIAFQLADDALDYGGSQDATGKGVGDDFREGKATMPVLLAYRQASEEEREFWQRVIIRGERDESDLGTAQKFLARHGGLERTLEVAERYAAAARAALAEIEASPLQAALSDLTRAVVRRAA